MALSKAQRLKPGFPLSTPPFVYGVSVVILALVGYAVLGVFPTLSRTLELADQVMAEDVPSLQRAGELHLRLAEDHAALGAFLVSPARAGAVKELEANDEAVATATANLTGSVALAQFNQAVFAEDWKRYRRDRARLFEDVSRRGVMAAVVATPDLGERNYHAAQEVLRNAELAQESLLASHITGISEVLGRAREEMAFLVAMMLMGLVLILWLDRRGKHAERQLERTQLALRAQEKNIRDVFNGAAVGMVTFKPDGTVVSVNEKGSALLGYEPEEMIGMKVASLIGPEYLPSHLKDIAATGDGELTYTAERRMVRKDGTAAWVRNSVTLIQPEDGEPYFFAICEEITAQKEAHDRLEWLANYDAVTALPRRHSFEEMMTRMLGSQAKGGSSVALLYIEIDGFEFLKGTFGRLAADTVLAELGAALRASAADGEAIGCLDDYAFGVLMPSAAYGGAAVKRAEELLELFRRLPDSGVQGIPLSASIGVVYAGDLSKAHGRTLDGAVEPATETMLKLARAAMLEARSRGGDVVQVADPALQERALQRHRIETALLRGIQRDEFHVVFQPQFRLANGMLVRFEALCRWDSVELGSIAPDRFIPIAEESGLMPEIGRRVMIDALRQARRWTDTGRKIGISVNISPIQFMRPDFTGQLSEALAMTGFPPALLELEITEGIFIRDLNLAVARIRDLQRLGVTVALDDFGTGYSSLSYLQRMPIDAVKLDRSFVSELTADESTVSMVRSVLAMARALDLRVVTEGVETREQLEILRELGCDEAQGFLLGRPEDADVAYQRVMDSPRAAVGMYA